MPFAAPTLAVAVSLEHLAPHCYLPELGVWGATEQNAELRILFQIQSRIKSGVSNLRYGRSLER